jgi:hypothetical protein
MTIPHWLIGIVILGMATVFVIFAFGQGITVKPDRNKRHEPDDWARPAPQFGY